MVCSITVLWATPLTKLVIGFGEAVVLGRQAVFCVDGKIWLQTLSCKERNRNMKLLNLVLRTWKPELFYVLIVFTIGAELNPSLRFGGLASLFCL